MRILICLLIFNMGMASNLMAKTTEDLLEMDTEELFELSLNDLLDLEITSASKMAEKISEIPASVYIMTREEIETYGFPTLVDLIRSIPGFYSLYDFQEDRIGVRGILDANDMVLLVNGLVQHTSNINDVTVPVEAIDRIEVVRGPMSVIYGSGAFLGSINIVTNQIPYDAPINRFSMTLGSLNTQKMFARASGDAVTYQYTLNASYYGTGGIDRNYQDMMSTDQYTDLPDAAHKTTRNDLERENRHFNFSARHGSLSVDLQYNRAQNEIYDGHPIVGEGERETTDIIAIQFGLQHPLSQSLHINSHIISSRIQSAIFDANSNFATRDEEEKFRQNRFQWEFDLIWNPDESIDIISGICFKKLYHSIYQDPIPHFPEASAIPENTNFDLLSYNFSDQDTHSFFIQAAYEPFPKFRLISGARVERYLGFDTQMALINNNLVTYERRVHLIKNDKVYFIPRGALVYSVTDHQFLKLMYGEANKPMVMDQLDFLSFAESVQINLDPEEIKTLELNYLILLNRFGFSASLFRNQVNHLIRFVMRNVEDDTFDTQLDNLDRRETYGGELIATTQLGKDWNFELGATYQETSEKSGPEKNIEYSPHLLFKLKAGYHLGRYHLGITGLYVDEMRSKYPTFTTADDRGSENFSATSPPPVMTYRTASDYFLTNLNLTYHHSSGAFAGISVNNILDQEVRYPPMRTAMFEKGLLDKGRTFLFSLGFDL